MPQKALDRLHAGKWDFEYQKEHGFYGANLTDVSAAHEPYSNWIELTGTIANHVACSRAMLRRSNL